MKAKSIPIIVDRLKVVVSGEIASKIDQYSGKIDHYSGRVLDKMGAERLNVCRGNPGTEVEVLRCGHLVGDDEGDAWKEKFFWYLCSVKNVLLNRIILKISFTVSAHLKLFFTLLFQEV